MRIVFLLAAVVTLLGSTWSSATPPAVHMPREIDDPQRYVRMALEADAIGRLTEDWTFVSGHGEYMVDSVVHIVLTFEREPKHSPNQIHYTWHCGVEFRADTILDPQALRSLCESQSARADSVEAMREVKMYIDHAPVRVATVDKKGGLWQYASTNGDTLFCGPRANYIREFVFRTPYLADRAWMFLGRYVSQHPWEFSSQLGIQYARLEDNHYCISTCDSCGGEGYWFTEMIAYQTMTSFCLPNWCDWRSFYRIGEVHEELSRRRSAQGEFVYRVDTTVETGFTYMPHTQNSLPRRVYTSVRSDGDRLCYVSMVVATEADPRQPQGFPPVCTFDSLQFHEKWPPTEFRATFPK